MIIVSSKEMRLIEKEYIDEYGMNNDALMECAVRGMLEFIDITKNVYSLICGFGNNGCDALCIARYLSSLGKTVNVLICRDNRKISEGYINNIRILNKLNVDVKTIVDLNDYKYLENKIIESDIVIDGLFGSGINRSLSQYYIDIINIVNEKSKYIISIDIPSGMNGTNGEILGDSIKADETLCVGFLKKGFYNAENLIYTGKINIIPLYIPKEIVEKYCGNINTLDKTYISSLIPKRMLYAHKGTFGRVSLIAGSKKYTGAAILCTKATVKTGSGLISLYTSEDIVSIVQSNVPEAMVSIVGDCDNWDSILNSDVIACGPGMGCNESTRKIVERLINDSKCPIVFDADAINSIANDISILDDLNQRIILTPHPGEMARLCKCSIKDINNNRIDYAVSLAKKYDVIVVLKGYRTVITDGNKTFINTTGNSAMSSGGMGDCLTGIITSLISQGLKPLDAAVVGVYIHGDCADVLEKSNYCIDASTLIDKIPYILKNNMS